MQFASLFILPSAVPAADAYPSKPVRLIIPFPPGGSNDIVGRLIAAKLSERLGKQVVVDNRGGAGGVIGTEMAAKADPDGYTLLIASAAYAINPALYKLPYDPMKSFTPIAKLGSGPNVARRPSERSGQLGERAHRTGEAEARPADLCDVRASAASSIWGPSSSR